MELLNHPQDYFYRLFKTIFAVSHNDVFRFITKIASFSKTDKTIFIIGNGGSAATASHMACDFGKTILSNNIGADVKYHLRVTSLNDNVPYMTALANDFGYERVFSEQLQHLGRANDMLIVITGSGNSPNIIQAVLKAKEMGIYTYGLLGFGGGQVKYLLDDMILIDSNDYGVVEDMHMIINHLVTDWFKKQNFQK